MGRPLAYKNAKRMQAAIDSYFEQCKAEDITPTVTELALALGFSSRQGLLNYERGERGECEEVRQDFVYVVKRAKARIEAHIERELIDGKGNAVGKIFHLKNNCGWIDKQEVEQTGGVTVNIAAFGSPEQARPEPLELKTGVQAIETITVEGVYEDDE